MINKEQVLIIKAGYSEFLEEEKDSRTVSLGDVLRITPILHLYKGTDVTWVTDKKAFPLLEGNKYINRLLRLDWLTANQLKEERFDTLINLEKVPGICVLADDIHAVRRYGFRFDPESRKASTYDKAAEVLTVSSEPTIKKGNKKTVQELLFEMVGKKWQGEEYILGYKPKTKERYDVGLNTRVGQKWPTKQWPKENWDKLEQMLLDGKYKVTRQDKQDKKILDNLYSYIDWINSCKTVITNDSLGLHLSLALKKQTLGLFGATSNKEVYFYQRGEAILPPNRLDCLPCFSSKCIKKELCMNKIKPQVVHDRFIKLIKNHK